jgi:predicted DNA-binding protein
MRTSLERINLNVPGDARKRLRGIAKRIGRTESEVAREIFLDGLNRFERNQFYERVASELTPEIRRRMAEVAEAMSRIND